MDYISHYYSPLGGITLASNGNELTGLWFDGQKYFKSTLSDEFTEKELPVFYAAKMWLDIYFSRGIPDFTPPLCVNATAFRREVIEIILKIPYGHTMTYGEIAEITAKRKNIKKMSPQAVGGAVGHNPISIIIPCHRVLGTGGKLTGYAGGTKRKIKLLELENIR